jgi:hypothetical protein
MVPSSLTKMKSAGLPGLNRKAVAFPLNTIPVGDPGGGWLGAFGTTTTPLGLMGMTAPAPVRRSELPSLLSEIHQGLVALRTNPQGFLRCASAGCVGAGVTVAPSDNKLVWL